MLQLPALRHESSDGPSCRQSRDHAADNQVFGCSDRRRLLNAGALPRLFGALSRSFAVLSPVARVIAPVRRIITQPRHPTVKQLEWSRRPPVAFELPVATPAGAPSAFQERNGTSVLPGSCQNQGHQITSALCPQGHSRQQEKKKRSRPVMSQAARLFGSSDEEDVPG